MSALYTVYNSYAQEIEKLLSFALSDIKNNYSKQLEDRYKHSTSRREFLGIDQVYMHDSLLLSIFQDKISYLRYSPSLMFVNILRYIIYTIQEKYATIRSHTPNWFASNLASSLKTETKDLIDAAIANCDAPSLQSYFVVPNTFIQSVVQYQAAKTAYYLALITLDMENFFGEAIKRVGNNLDEQNQNN